MTNYSPKVKLFGTSCTPSEASVVVIPIPWGVTAPSRSSAALGPDHILKASYQVKSFPTAYANGTKLGIAMLPIPHNWKMISDSLRHHTLGHIHAVESGSSILKFKASLAKKVDQYAYELKEQTKVRAHTYLKQEKMVVTLGGDHSTSLGLIEAMADHYNNMGILHIGANPAMHQAYQGVKHSHASTIYNVLELAHVVQVVQIGLRDCTPEEQRMVQLHEGRVHPFYHSSLKQQQLQGATWHELCMPIIKLLPDRVYINFNINGLDPKLCPSTGAPVPNGLELDEVYYLIDNIVKAGKQIVGADLCEVAPGENMDWDAQVGSRVLQYLCMAIGASQGKLTSKSAAPSTEHVRV
ncbi:MAG: arginase family protein [Bacteroidota bacterium]